MNYTKKLIKEEIEKLEKCIPMEADIRKVIDELKHYKQVNKKFTDRLNELGYFSYILRDKWKIEFVCRVKGSNTIEFRACTYTPESLPLTWELILNEFKRYSYDSHLDLMRERLAIIDKETIELKELIDLMESKKFKCFSLFSEILDLQRAYENALRDGNA